MKIFLTFIFVLLFESTTISQPSFEYYRNPDKVGSSNEKAFEYFKTAYYDHVFSWTRNGADSALYYLNKAVTLDPEYGAAYALLGHIYQYLTYGNNYTRDNIKSEEEYALLAKKYAPNLGDTYTLLADVLWGQGKKDSSIALLKKAVEIEPDHAGNHIWLGIRYSQTDGKAREAQQEYNYILNEIDSAYGQAYMKMGALFEFQIKDLDSAKLYYKLAEQLYNTMPVKDDRMLVSKFALAAIAYDQGEISKSIDYYINFEKTIINKDLFFDFHLKGVYRSLMFMDSANQVTYRSKYVDYVENQPLKTDDHKITYVWDYMNLEDN